MTSGGLRRGFHGHRWVSLSNTQIRRYHHVANLAPSFVAQSRDANTLTAVSVSIGLPNRPTEEISATRSAKRVHLVNHAAQLGLAKGTFSHGLTDHPDMSDCPGLTCGHWCFLQMSRQSTLNSQGGTLGIT